MYIYVIVYQNVSFSDYLTTLYYRLVPESMSTSLSDISSGLSIYVSPSILVSQIYCACCFCCSLMTQIFMSPARYKGRDFRDKKFLQAMRCCCFRIRCYILPIRSAVVSESGSLRERGRLEKGAPLSLRTVYEKGALCR